MRIIYPDSIIKELDYLEQFLESNGKGFQAKSDAPEGTQERYEAVRKKMAAIRDDFMAWDVEHNENGNLRIIKPSGEIITARKVTDDELIGTHKRKKKSADKKSGGKQ